MGAGGQGEKGMIDSTHGVANTVHVIKAEGTQWRDREGGGVCGAHARISLAKHTRDAPAASPWCPFGW